MFSKPSEFLREIDSHGIYSTKMLNECAFETECVPCFTPAETRAKIEARGLGGYLDEDADEWLFSGYTAATALARQFLGDAPGLKFQGRGSSFRADLAALEEAGH